MWIYNSNSLFMLSLSFFSFSLFVIRLHILHAQNSLIQIPVQRENKFLLSKYKKIVLPTRQKKTIPSVFIDGCFTYGWFMPPVLYFLYHYSIFFFSLPAILLYPVFKCFSHIYLVFSKIFPKR